MELLPSGGFLLRTAITPPPITVTVKVPCKWDNWLFCQEIPVPAHGRENHWGNGYSAVNYKLLDEEST
jgi:hypothetical protein